MRKSHAQKNFAQISHQMSIKVGRNGQNLIFEYRWLVILA